MAFSIEALQCKSRINNLKSRQFATKTLFPEMMPREIEPDLITTTQNVKNAMLSAITKVIQAMGKSADAQRFNEQDVVDRERIVASEDTDSDGFIVVSLAKVTCDLPGEPKRTERKHK